MAKYLVETYYTCSFKVKHYLNDLNDSELSNLEKRDDGKFEILDVKLDNRKTKNLDPKNQKINNMDVVVDTPKVKNVSKDINSKLYKDNDERSIFYCKGVIETIKKLNWAPDLIHVHGWIASLLPLYMKYYYKNDPIFEGTKVIVSLYDNCLEGQMDKNFVKKIKFDEIDESNVTILNDSSYQNLYKISLLHADGAIFSSDVKEKFSDILNELNIPVVECSSASDDYKEKCLNFYNSFLQDEK